MISNFQVLSKSQRKRARLIARARNGSIVTLATGTNAQPRQVAQTPNPGQGRSRNARRRRRDRQNGGMNGGGGVMSDYLRTLMDPENTPGVKVPDLVTFPSSTFQLSYDNVLNVPAAGDACGVWFCPFIGSGATRFPIYSGNNTAVGGNVTYTGVNWASRASVAAIFGQIRPVSAVLIGEFTGNSTGDSGQVCYGILERGTTGTGSIIPFGTAQAQNFNKTSAARDGCRVLWKPQDNQDLEYDVVTADLDAQGMFMPAIFFCTSGMAGNSSYRVRIVVNYEGIPTVDTFNIVNVEPSQSNLPALEQAMNWAGQAYNNLSSFVESVGPYVQPIVRSAMQVGAPLLGARLGQAMGGRGNQRMLRY
jgi:hypothetical protein